MFFLFLKSAAWFGVLICQLNATCTDVLCCIWFMTFGTKLMSWKGPTAVAIHFLTPSMSYIITAFVCFIMVCWLNWEIIQVQLF